MKIHDRVKSKNPDGQVQDVGTVVAIFDPMFYIAILPQDVTADSLDRAWHRYSNWREKPVCAIQFDVPQRIATLDEWVADGKAKGIPHANLAESYEAHCPTTTVIGFPVDDLEKAEDYNDHASY